MIERLRSEIKNAMAEKLKTKTPESVNRYQTLKNILETAQKEAKNNKSDVITDSLIVNAAKKEIKQLNDLFQFDITEDKRREVEYCISVAEEFLPSMASEDDIRKFIDEHRSEINNIGEAMKLLSNEFGDSLDKKLASGIVRSIL